MGAVVPAAESCLFQHQQCLGFEQLIHIGTVSYLFFFYHILVSECNAGSSLYVEVVPEY